MVNFSLLASKNSNFRGRIYKEFWDNFEELISGIFWGLILGTSFGIMENFSLENKFREEFWGVIL